jgi:hypothetical protein
LSIHSEHSSEIFEKPTWWEIGNILLRCAARHC